MTTDLEMFEKQEAMTVKDVLIAARKLIEKEDDWGQGVYHSRGRRCATAALGEILGGIGRAVGSDAYHALEGAMGCGHQAVCEFNDSHTHAEVLAAFDKAIASCGD